MSTQLTIQELCEKHEFTVKRDRNEGYKIYYLKWSQSREGFDYRTIDNLQKLGRIMDIDFKRRIIELWIARPEPRQEEPRREIQPQQPPRPQVVIKQKRKLNLDKKRLGYLRSMQNPLLKYKLKKQLEKLNDSQDIDLELIDPNLEYDEALNAIKESQPHLITSEYDYTDHMVNEYEAWLEEKQDE